MSGIAAHEHHIPLEVAECRQPRARQRLARNGRSYVPLLQCDLVDGEFSRQKEIAHRWTTIVGHHRVVVVADRQVFPPLWRHHHVVVTTERKRRIRHPGRAVEGPLMKLRLVHLGYNRHEGIDTGIVQLDEGLVHQPRSIRRADQANVVGIHIVKPRQLGDEVGQHGDVGSLTVLSAEVPGVEVAGGRHQNVVRQEVAPQVEHLKTIDSIAMEQDPHRKTLCGHFTGRHGNRHRIAPSIRFLRPGLDQ